MVDSQDLVIPVYLSQRIVFDLVAVLQGGIASVTQVQQTQAHRAGEKRELGTSFGLAEALSSLLKISLSGKRDRQSSDESSTTTSQDRVHTPASLFITLRAILRDKQCLKVVGAGSAISPGDLIEFSSVLKKNPLLETLESFSEMIDTFQALLPRPEKGKGKEVKEFAEFKKQIASLLSSLRSGQTVDLTTPALPSSHRAVISLETQNLNDPTMSDLLDGTFRVVGKVTRCLGKSDGAISLNRKSAISRLPASILQEFKSALRAPELAEMALPELEWEIPGPAIQVLPIAIFA